MKIAWGITGAGHLLNESIEIIEKLLKDGHELDVFFSAAGKVVAKMYEQYRKIEKYSQDKEMTLRKVIFDEPQYPAFPVCAHFNLQHYDLLIISPITSNSVAKMSNGIADTLITNIFAQMIKGNGRIMCVPTDLVSGKIETRIPNGNTVKITVDEFNSKVAKDLAKFKNVTVFETPQSLYEQFKNDLETLKQ